MERRQRETIRDFTIIFEKEECAEVGMKIDEETLGYLMMLKGNISNMEKAVILGACGDNMKLENVKQELIRIKQIEEIKNVKEETLIERKHKEKCYRCGMKGHWARQCRKCKCCKKGNQKEDECWF